MCDGRDPPEPLTLPHLTAADHGAESHIARSPSPQLVSPLLHPSTPTPHHARGRPREDKRGGWRRGLQKEGRRLSACVCVPPLQPPSLNATA